MNLTANRSSWLQETLASLAVASGIGYVATVYTVSRWLTRSTRTKPTLPDDAWNCTWQELECRTSDGLKLKGWAITPPHPRATIAIFHGIRGDRTRTLNRVALLVRAGYRCVAFDHRAHGESDGRVTSFGYFEGRDVSAVLDLIRHAWPSERRVALGVSMGAAALCYSPEAARACDAIILESVYHDLLSTFHNRIGTEFPGWFRHFSKGVVWLTERRLRLRMEQLSPWRCIHELAPAPVLLLTGERDEHATPEEVRLIYESCREPREFHIIPEAGHTDIVEVGGRRYEELILGFLERRLAAGRRLAA